MGLSGRRRKAVCGNERLQESGGCASAGSTRTTRLGNQPDRISGSAKTLPPFGSSTGEGTDETRQGGAPLSLTLDVCVCVRACAQQQQETQSVGFFGVGLVIGLN